MQDKTDDASAAAESSSKSRLWVLGTPLEITSYDAWATACQRLARRPGCTVIDFSNTQIVTLRRHEPEFRRLTGAVDFFIPDGMPLIWCLNRQGAGLNDRVYGPTFMSRLILNSPDSLTHYLFGGSPQCLASLKANLLRQNPKLNIAGSTHGYLDAAGEARLADELDRLSPDFIWVGLGTPKQQNWAYRYKARLSRGAVFLVGFAFDVNAGTKPDAPQWMQRRGLTWLHRLGSEPRRLASRYLRYNSLFLFYLLWDGLRGRAWKEKPGK